MERPIHAPGSFASIIMPIKSLIALWVLFWVLSVHAAEVPSRLEMGTGVGVVLDRQVLGVEGVGAGSGAALRIDIEFATAERVLPGEVIDSFTLTLRNASGSSLIPLVSVDAFGPAWLPASPGAPALVPQAWLQSELKANPREGYFLNTRWTAVFELPPSCLSQPLQLVASLFDNLDSQPSVAFIHDARVVSSLTLPIVLESSASLFGPFATEPSAQVDRANRLVRLSRPSPQRFFRLSGDTPSRIVKMSRQGTDWALDYEADLGTPVLRVEGSNDRSLFTRVSNATIDLTARTARIPLLNSFAFFRMGGSHPVRIVGDEVSGETRILRFEVFPRVPGVVSSSQFNGPFAQEGGVKSDAFAKRLLIPAEGFTRYFRLSSAVGLELEGLTMTETEWVLHYAER